MSQVRSRWPPVGKGIVIPFDLDRIDALCDRGLFLQAHELTRPHGPLHAWSGTKEWLVAGTLAGELGAPHLGSTLLMQAAADSRSPEARVRAGRHLLIQRGPMAAWSKVKTWVEPSDDAPRETRAGWLALKATIVAQFRDFETSEALARRAIELAPDSAAVWTARALVLAHRDRYGEALEAAREGLRKNRLHRPTVEVACWLLLARGRREEALELLRHADAETESGRIAGRIALLLHEMGDHEGALSALDRFEERAPLLERDGRQWAESRRSDALYALGDLEGARRHARNAGTSFYAALVGRLAGGNGRSRRVRLPFPFVRQDHDTCSPATLAALCTYFERPVDQAQIAQAMCYGGTPLHKARAWAEETGWVVREFRVTWGSACALLDRGIPFALATSWAMNGHHQAVVGYDARRNSLSVRCPSDPILQELPAEALQQFAWCGPRGLALVPREEEHRLEGLDLPDRAAYDALQALAIALEQHKPEEAQAIHEKLAGALPRHPLAIWSRLRLAEYHSNGATRLQCVRALLDLFPDTPALLFLELSILRELDAEGDYRRRLEDACSRHPHDPFLASRWAYELSRRPDEHDQARRILRTSGRWSGLPVDALNLVSLAHLAVDERPTEARELFRFACCMEDKNESYARVYFENTKNELDEALGFLRSRAAKLGRQSSEPILTLVHALRDSGRRQEAREALDQALALHPGEGPLQVSAASLLVSFGELDRAEALLAAARGRVRRGDWQSASTDLFLARRSTSPAPPVPPVARPAARREPATRPALPRVAAPSPSPGSAAKGADPSWLAPASILAAYVLQAVLRHLGAL